MTVLATATALSLTACSGPAPTDAAAVVKGHSISVSEVQKAAADIKISIGGDGTVSEPIVLEMLVLDPFLQDLATKYNLSVSADDVKKGFSGKPANPSKGAIDAMHANMILSKLQQLDATKAQQATTDLKAALQDAKPGTIVVNPRYGSFDAHAKNFSLTNFYGPVTENWLDTANTGVLSGQP